jgi:hypothetical protein
VRRSLADWLRFMKLAPAGPDAELDHYTYATSHEELDQDAAVQDEVRNAAHTLAQAVMERRAGGLTIAGANLSEVRQKQVSVVCPLGFPATLDVLRLLVVHPGEFIARGALRVQQFVELGVKGLGIAMTGPLDKQCHQPH